VPRLIVTKGADEGKQFDLTLDRLTVGRESSNRIRLTDTEVSRRHAEFVRTPEGYRLLDVGSANGTFVNSRPIRDVLLQPGDQVQIGQTTLVFTAVRGDALPPGDLADRINLISKQELDLPSAIVKAISATEGSRIMARPEKVEGPWLRANLGILYEAIQAASEILDVPQLLERLLELSFRSLQADHGCILLGPAASPDAPGERSPEIRSSADLYPQIVRWRQENTTQERVPVSRTLLDHVLREKQGILVSDAARDERFQSAQSIVKAGVREIICVPMRGRHDTVGVLYLDTVTPSRELVAAGISGKFNADHLALAIALAHQAAIAIEETRYYQAMVQAERLAAVGQTMAALAHNIKNILQNLRSGGEILAMGIQEKDEALLQQGWKLLQKNHAKVYDLVMDMLSYSKEREPVIEDTDLNAVAGEVFELLSARAQEMGVALNLVPCPALRSCPADAEGIHRALLNIVGNALDAVEGGEAPIILVSLAIEAGGGWVRLTVKDNGPGIPAEKREDIFRPFVSTKGSRGTGLGLPVSRKILREHGGDILVESEPGKGSTFILRLPLPVPAASDNLTSTRHVSLPPTMKRPEG
jgi:signal transduction histidine kinase/pSer/pThr/pTyr-binding forkhead associated (FHA) protein